MFSPLTDGEIKVVAQAVRGRSRSQIFLSPHTQISSQRVVTATVPFHAIIQWLLSAFVAQLRPHSRASQQHCTQNATPAPQCGIIRAYQGNQARLQGGASI